MKSVTDGDERLYILAAFSIFLSIVEYMIPKPLPFLRIGLANLPILISLAVFPPRKVLALTVYKVVGQSLVQGTLFSYVALFSAAGSMAAALVMLGTHRLLGSRVSLIGVSVAGALAGNLVRLVLARYIVFGEQVWIMAPPFLILGLVSSVLLGWFGQVFVARSRWLASGGAPA